MPCTTTIAFDPENRSSFLPPSGALHSTMLVFGGSAWVADPDADNSYGYTTKHVNDLWSLDLSGADDYTWEPVYAVAHS